MKLGHNEETSDSELFLQIKLQHENGRNGEEFMLNNRISELQMK